MHTSQLELIERESARWVADDVISATQRSQILARYSADAEAAGAGPAATVGAPQQPAEDAAQTDERHVRNWVPAILITAAVILLGVGLTLFYAANWRKMSAGLKIVQVFVVLLGSYGGAYYFLFSKRIPVVGRGLLLLAMLTFGAAIGLVAQVFHISAHPANGVLLWGAGVLAMALVMEERFGLYLAFVLLATWNCWELTEYHNPNFAYALVLPLLFWGSYRLRDQLGLIASTAAGLLFFYQLNIHYLGTSGAVALLLLQPPLGVLLVAQRTLLTGHQRLGPVSALLEVIGWLCIAAPLFALSWPIDLAHDFPLFASGQRWVAIEFGALLAADLGALYLLWRRGKKPWLLAGATACALLFALAPLGQQSVLVTLTHGGLLALIFGLLTYGYGAARREVTRTMGILTFMAALIGKAIGLFGLSLFQRKFFVAYNLGSVVLATVLFLAALYIDARLRPRSSASRLPLGLLCGTAAISVYLTLYAVSFRVPPQSSVLEATNVVVVLLGLFLLVALALFALLWRQATQRLLLALASVVFAASVLTLFTANPSLPWPVYSLVFNVLLLAVEGGVLVYAVRRNSVVLANLAIVGFALQVLTRYFDLFWDLLSGSLLFIVTGALLFGGGVVLELNRRKVVELARDAQPAAGEDGR
jgi:uncharacterized membrane protein